MRLIAADDEYLALKDLVEALREALPDADVQGFQTAREALLSAAGTPVDAAFLDIEMAGMNGLALAKELKEIRSQTNIVFVTGYSQYAVEAFSVSASDYLLKPVTAQEILRAVSNMRSPLPAASPPQAALPHGAQCEEQCKVLGEAQYLPATSKLWVRAFGNFEVFVSGAPLRFPRSKSKELFAYLIHKRGTGCSTRELAAVLYEDQPYTLSLQKQVQTILSAMIRTLKDAGVSDCIVRSYNRTSLDVTRVDCDYYRFLNRDTDAVNQYTGEYMSNYSWAEFVIGYLDSRIESPSVHK